MSRETEINTVLNAVIETSPNWYDDPNGPYRTTCPFCGARLNTGGENPYPNMEDLVHEFDCAWVIAKGLMTGIN